MPCSKLLRLADRLDRLKPSEPPRGYHGSEYDLMAYSRETERFFMWWWTHWLALPDSRGFREMGIFSRLTAFHVGLV